MLLMPRENKRLQVIHRVLEGEFTVREASELVGVSERQFYRVLAAVRALGARGVVHGNRERVPWNKLSEKMKEKILALRRGLYAGFNDRHFCDELIDEEKLSIGRESVRQLLRRSGIEAVRPMKKRKHRRRRDPREHFGELLQGDGSEHDWLEGRGPRLTLIHFIDDATSKHWARFFYRETTEAYFTVIDEIIREYGLPGGLYVDFHGVFSVNQGEHEAGKKPLTQFSRAMEELAVAVIFAGSPQAKGRVERRGGLDQDRLVSELRKTDAKTLHDANRVLKRYLVKSNRRFVRHPKNPTSAFTSLPDGCDLKQILCWKEERTVANDNTIAYHGQKLQLPKSPHLASLARKKVVVHLCLDGSVHVFHRHERVAYFKRLGIDPGMVPIVSAPHTVVAAHSPTLTFSLGH